MPTTQPASTEEAIWGRLLNTIAATLSPEAARAILELDFPPEDKARLHELAQTAQAGALTVGEQEEIDNYGKVASILGVFQSKARIALRRASNANRRTQRR